MDRQPEVVELDDVLQEAFLSFYRAAPQQPNLLATDDLSRVLSYLRFCVKTAILMLLRKQRMPMLPLELLPDLPTQEDISLTIERRILLIESIRSILQTPIERLIFQQHFLYGLKPQEIVEKYTEQFVAVTDVNIIVQRLTRRMRKDANLQALRAELGAARQKAGSSASLEISVVESEGAHTPVDSPCTIEEDVLIAYITGHTTAEARAAIERSSACRRAAAALGQEILPLLQAIYRGECPPAETLVAYQEHRLSSNELLLLRAHVLECTVCQSECALLAAVDVVPLGPAPGPLRRLVEALLAPLPSLALRGNIRWYQATEISIIVSERPSGDQPRSWTLRGDTRTPDGLLALDVVTAAMLQSLDEPGLAEYIGQVEPDGGFVFCDLSTGTYRLRLLAADMEIVISRLDIGEV